MNKSITTKAPAIKQTDPLVLELWVKAGGRCEFLGCNNYLLQDELTANEVKLADIAHIVARSKDGPRGDDHLPIANRNDISNLMLACPIHHRLIDNKKMVTQYSKELLGSYKRAHEDRIRYLTGFGPEFETVIIRMIGNIRGDTVVISDEQVRESVLDGAGRYPRYLNSENTIEIDLRGIPEANDEQYWNAGKTKIDEIVKRHVQPAIEQNKIKHLSIFGIARIPFLMHLGHVVGDKIPIDLYQKHRNEKENWVWSNTGIPVTFKFERIRIGADDSKVALLLSLSGKIPVQQLPSQITSAFSVYEITPIGIEPNRSLISTKGSLESFKYTYQALLRLIESEHSTAEEIHLFPAIPTPVAIICGRELLKDITPEIHIYEKTEQDYKLSTKIN